MITCLAIKTCNTNHYKITFTPEYTYFHREHLSLSSNIPSVVKLNNYRSVDHRYLNSINFVNAVIQRFFDRPTYRLPRKIRKLKFVKEYETKKYKKMEQLTEQEFTDFILWFRHKV